MPCAKVAIGDITAIVCSRGSRAPKCRFCRKRSSKLCDAVIGKTLAGKDITCDAPICLDHARPDPRNPNRDLCPKHVGR